MNLETTIDKKAACDKRLGEKERVMDTKIDIQKLLELKRREAAPPSDFHEIFLTEFQRRQRIDFLKRTLRPSLRKTFVERSSLFLASLHVPLWAYIAIALVGVLLSLGIWVYFPGYVGKNSNSLTNSNKQNIEIFPVKSPVKIPGQQQTIDILQPRRYSLEDCPVSYKVPRK